MANGIIHRSYANGAAIIIGATATAAAIAIHPALLGVAVGGMVGKVCDPDLDLEQNHTQSEQRIWKHSRALGFLWSLYWWPYAKLRPHRGISHTWPTGTLERFAYALWPIIVLSWVYAPDGILWACWWALVFVGLSIQDCVHLWLDGVL